jgi:triosephosphate isomerase
VSASTVETFIGVSTKAYFGVERTRAWLQGVRAVVDARPGLGATGVQMFVNPSFPFLGEARDVLGGAGCWIGAQDGHWAMGAATGAVPMELIAELGGSLVELGHSERRTTFHETEGDITRKVSAALAAGLVPLVCVGGDERGAVDDAAHTCIDQVGSAAGRDPRRIEAMIIAYEPRWAIGATEPAGTSWVNEVIRIVRAGIRDEWGVQPRGILYGGSAGPGIFAALTECDGLFLGRSAHDPAKLAQVLDEAARRVPRAG